MNPIQHWQHLQQQGNQAFRQQQWQLASEYYLHSILLIRHHLPIKLHSLVPANAQDAAPYQFGAAADLLICLSIAIQNLAEVYARQQRWRRCHSLLNRALNRLQQLQQQVAPSDNASVILLQECCSLRRELCRHTLSCNACMTKTPSIHTGLVSSRIH
ncbi:hypothetical protein [Alishewanella longhuensis]